MKMNKDNNIGESGEDEQFDDSDELSDDENSEE